jgi:hypothetical protein
VVLVLVFFGGGTYRDWDFWGPYRDEVIARTRPYLWPIFKVSAYGSGLLGPYRDEVITRTRSYLWPILRPVHINISNLVIQYSILFRYIL